MDRVAIVVSKYHQKFAERWFQKSLETDCCSIDSRLARQHADYHYSRARKLMGIEE